jgi:hypothetical protein
LLIVIGSKSPPPRRRFDVVSEVFTVEKDVPGFADDSTRHASRFTFFREVGNRTAGPFPATVDYVFPVSVMM